MAEYLKMDKEALRQERELLLKEYNAFKDAGLKLDMSRGKPAAEQFDISMPLLAVQDYIDEDGTDTRNYGLLEGCGEARRYFGGLLGTDAKETFVGGSSSLSLMYGMIDLGWRKGYNGGKPWKDCESYKFICPSPGYDRHFRITQDFGFELIMVDMAPDGPDMDAVEELVKDEAVKGMWMIPVYSNPDGYTCSAETVERLAKMETAAPDFKIFWDNAYGFHHLYDTPDTCPNLLAECKKTGNEDRALMFMSTSKITFAGAGVSAMGASQNNMAQASEYFFPMLISFDKINQLHHTRFLKAEGIENHMKKHAAFLLPKFQMVWDVFENGLGGGSDIARWTKPNGGYFISLFVLPGCAARVVQLCKEAGVVLTGAGAAYPYGKDPKDTHIRIAPTFPPLAELETAAKLVCVATRLACCEKLLAAE